MLVRPSVISPAGGALVIAGVAATTYMARDENHRYGIQNEDGEVPLLGDFRVMAVLGALVLNALPTFADRLLVPMLGSVPILGGVAEYLATSIPHALQDYAQLAGLVAAASFVGTEALASQETGQFAGFDLPQFLLMDDFSEEEGEPIALVEEPIALVEEPALNSIAAG